MNFVTVSFVLSIALVSSVGAYVIYKRIGDRILFVTWSPRTIDRSFYLLPIIYFAVFATLSITSFLSFHTDGFDLSIFHQVVWNSLHGRLFENTILHDAPFLLGQRFDPVLLGFVPLYALWSSPIVLLIVQTLGIAISGFPLYWIARERLGRPLAFVLVIAFYLSPALEYVNLAEFHEIALAIPLFSFATFFLLRNRQIPFLVCLGLALLVKEDCAFVVGMFGIYILVVQRRLWLGAGLTAFGAAWSVLLLGYVLPFFNSGGEGYYYFGHGIYAGTGRYDYLGTSLPQILATVLTQPGVVLSHVWVPQKIEFVLALGVPIALLPLAGADLALLALPTFATSLLSDYGLQTSIQSHYPSSLLPFLYFGTAVGMQRIVHWRASETEIRARLFGVGVLVLAASGASYYYLAPGPLARNFQPALYEIRAHTVLGRSMLDMIPPGAVVVAQGELTPDISGREFAYGFPSVTYCAPEYLVGDKTDPQYRMYQAQWQDWLGTGHFEMLWEQDGFFLARRKTPDHEINLSFGNQINLTRYTIAPETSRGGEPFCPIIVEWEAVSAGDSRYVRQVALQDMRGNVVADGEAMALTVGDSRSIQEQYSFLLSPALAEGDYQVTVGIYDPKSDSMLLARNAAGQNVGTTPIIGTVHIAKNKANVTARQMNIEQRYYVDMAEMRLLGYKNVPDRILAGQTLEVGVYWRARAKPTGDYEVAVQLRDVDGKVVLEQASRPAGGTYPTTQWNEGEVLLDWHDLVLPEEMQGTFQLGIVLRDVSSKQAIGQAPVKPVEIRSGD